MGIFINFWHHQSVSDTPTPSRRPRVRFTIQGRPLKFEKKSVSFRIIPEQLLDENMALVRTHGIGICLWAMDKDYCYCLYAIGLTVKGY